MRVVGKKIDAFEYGTRTKKVNENPPPNSRVNSREGGGTAFRKIVPFARYYRFARLSAVARLSNLYGILTARQRCTAHPIRKKHRPSVMVDLGSGVTTVSVASGMTIKLESKTISGPT